MTTTHKNPQLELAFKFIETTDNNLFLTGKAGTGKTTFLKNLQKSSPKRMIVVAPTGVAAINAGGVTIHSFFQMPFGPHIPRGSRALSQNDMMETTEQKPITRMSREKRNIIRSMDLLVIDEISMVRADLLDGIDEVLRRYRYRNVPFGGVQLLMIGDLQQLAPIVKPDERTLLQNYYDNFFFFGSKALQQVGFTSIELQHIYRQSDQHFIDLLNKVRENQLDSQAMQMLEQRHIPNFNPNDKEGYITLSTHNAQAQNINDSKLERLNGREYTSKASVQGEFPEYIYPTEKTLRLKIGAQVMFVKNDISPEKLFYNGKIGIVENIDDDGIIYVQCEDDDSAIAVETAEWQNMKYSINPENQEIEETPIGTFRQVPLKLAWAITIHKSQGLTFEKAIIDSQQAFAHGQVYVALSRCRTLEGLVLSSPVAAKGIISNATVNQFSQNVHENQPNPEQLAEAQSDFQLKLIKELFNFTLLQRQSNYCLKLCRTNAASLLGTPAVAFEKIGAELSAKFIQVANKFALQVNTLHNTEISPEENGPLQERIQKACAYFLTQYFEALVPILNNITIESDNRSVKSSLKRGLDSLTQEISIITACLDACQDGFNAKRYLEARAKASIEKGATKKTSQKVESGLSSADIDHPEAFSELKSWRHYQAQTDSIPHYMILTQKALIALAHFLPASLDEMKRIKGVGPKTIEKHGDDILQIILAYRDKNNITQSMPEPAAKKKKEKEDTKKLSFTLYSEGKSIEEIAGQRGLALSTIESHLAHYVGMGEIDVYKFITKEKLALIKAFFKKSGNYQMNEAKSALGNSVSYSDLRFAIKHLQQNNEQTAL